MDEIHSGRVKGKIFAKYHHTLLFSSLFQMVAPPKQRGSYPMFVFSDGLSSDVHMNDHNIEDEKYLRIRHMRRDQYGNMRSHTLDSEDFVILGS